jgi:hypothetical protein
MQLLSIYILWVGNGSCHLFCTTKQPTNFMSLWLYDNSKLLTDKRTDKSTTSMLKIYEYMIHKHIHACNKTYTPKGIEDKPVPSR